ncbi:MAG: Na+/H+ antiporter subunit E [Anaerolineae bacterium]|nr:Na+/H+ antiporter subunit E [Anaerolineae bacterium]
MLIYAFLALPLAATWMAISNQITVQSFTLGYTASLLTLTAMQPRAISLDWRCIPDQITALVIYVVRLFVDVVLSGIEVAGRILSPDMRLKPGIVAIPTYDETANSVVIALSANSITLTPGELVVETEHNNLMYVHALDVEDSAHNAPGEQKARLSLLYRIIGEDCR